MQPVGRFSNPLGQEVRLFSEVASARIMTVIGLNAIIHKRIESTKKFVPLTPSVTSYGMGWKTLQAVHYRGSAASGEFSLPPVPRHKLFLIIRPSERLELRSEGVRVNRPPAAGSIAVGVARPS